MHRLAIALVGLGVIPAAAFGQGAGDPIVGTWQGQLTPQLRIVFHVERGDDGTLAGTVDSPDQGAFGSPMSSVELDGARVTFGIAVFGASFTGTLEGETIAGTFRQGGAELPLTLSRSEDAPAAPARPQEPSGPLSYTSVDVTFPNPEAGIDLAGTLTLPAGAGPFPGVVLVSGSGPQDRNEALMGHKPFLVLADHLTRSGIAVLRYDDRGVGASEGAFATATSSDFTSDAVAAVAYLRTHEAVRRDGVGIVGHSEGGLIGPMAANRSSDVAFVVMLAGPGVTGIEILVAQGRLINEAAGAPPALTEANARIQQALADVVRDEPDPDAAAIRMREALGRVIESLPDGVRGVLESRFGEEQIEQTIAQVNSPWFRFFLHHDPRPDLERIRVPVLSVIGGKDLQVPAELNNPEIEAALARGGNPDATARILPGLNHLFQEAGTGSPTEYAQIEQTMSPSMMDVVSAWILERFGS